MGRTISYTSLSVLAIIAKSQPGVFARQPGSKTDLFCQECRCVISIKRGGSKDALRHCSTDKHKRNVKSNAKQHTLFDADNVAKLSAKAQAVLEVEVMMCQLIATKNICIFLNLLILALSPKLTVFSTHIPA